MEEKNGHNDYNLGKGGKPLCALYAKDQRMGCLGFLGNEEGANFQSLREVFSNETQKIYNETTTFHDGKWLMFELKDTYLFNDMERLLSIKRKPNR